MVYYNDNALRAIASCVKTPVKLDTNTALATRGKFAYVCVEVDLTRPLVGQDLLDGKWQQIEYEGLHEVCYNCGRYGHLKENCPIKRVTPEQGGSKATLVAGLLQQTSDPTTTEQVAPKNVKNGCP